MKPAQILLCTLTLLLCRLPAAGATAVAEPLALTDDLSVASLVEAVDQSLVFLRRQPAERTVRICGTLYTTAWLAESLESFAQLVATTGTGPELDRLVRQRFDICPATAADTLLVTGYYEPEVAGSLFPDPPYLHPLYRVPTDLVTTREGTGRMAGGKLSPYWSREEIETRGLLKGQELLYLADPVAAFILHVQGSGRVRLPDGTIRRVHFAAKNGLPYRSIGRLLVDEGKLKLEEVNMPAIRAYLADHPEERDRILRYNPSFIFFGWGEEGATPAGSLGRPLTAGRSVALDPARYPAGALGYLVSRKPVVDEAGQLTSWAPMGRFVLHQDSGSAIKGEGRLDLFWGGDRYAETAAGHMKQPGTLYFLIKKQQTAQTMAPTNR
ncbi:MAG: murein transglycosylase A [Desulfobulbaceae bacterium]|nr:murein transglycosylase A [Desulfobulbaceae bacterium]